MTTLILSAALAQVQFVTAVGGTGTDWAYSLVATTDGGYALAGQTFSFGAGWNDVLLAKFDAAGTLQWARALGGTGWDEAFSLIQTADGGFAVAGRTRSFGAGGADVLLAKFDGTGTLQWTRTLGGAGDDYAFSLALTSDGGYALAGLTNSFGAGGYDALLAKFDSAGIPQWTRTLGGAGDDEALSLVQNVDGSYVIAGRTRSFGAGGADVLLAKFDGTGTLQWTHTLGGTNWDYAVSLIQTSDGGYATAGATRSFGVGGYDLLLAKYDGAGSLQWVRVLGDTSYDEALSLVQTADGGYASAGYTDNFAAGGYDALLAKFDGFGTLQWARALGGMNTDIARSLVRTADGGYAVTGETQSYGAGAQDALLVKFDGAGASCMGQAVIPTVTNPSPTVTSPTPTVTSPSPTVTSPSPTVTSLVPAETTLCSVTLAERSPVGATPRLAVRLVRGGLSVSVTSPTGVAIYRADGRLVRTLTVRGTARVALRPGVYVLRDERGRAPTAAVAR